MPSSQCKAAAAENTGPTPTAGRCRRLPERQRLPRHLHRPETGARVWPDVDPDPQRRRGHDRRPAAGGTGAAAASRGAVRRPLLRPGLSSGVPGGPDQRLHPSGERVHDAVSRDQLARLQFLLERSAAPVRPQGFPVVPPASGHVQTFWVHAFDHARSGHPNHRDHSGVWRALPGSVRRSRGPDRLVIPQRHRWPGPVRRGQRQFDHRPQMPQRT